MAQVRAGDQSLCRHGEERFHRCPDPNVDEAGAPGLYILSGTALGGEGHAEGPSSLN